MQLGQDAVDEVKANDSAPAGQLPERGVRAAGDSSKGHQECHPSIGHSYQVGGEVRCIAKGGASLSEGRGGRYSKRRRREGILGNRRGLDVPGQGIQVSACTVAFNAVRSERLCEGE
eukprot:3225257-Pleurochrysis_carterae.AAC.1